MQVAVKVKSPAREAQIAAAKIALALASTAVYYEYRGSAGHSGLNHQIAMGNPDIGEARLTDQDLIRRVAARAIGKLFRPFTSVMRLAFFAIFPARYESGMSLKKL